mmetsp:Transcript_4963/g.15009  ORF Transcript_4963/g.15009 Transcript_4963/m.15009 type:complete len:277 (+) Transcript_4963:33-863(+)
MCRRWLVLVWGATHALQQQHIGREVKRQSLIICEAPTKTRGAEATKELKSKKSTCRRMMRASAVPTTRPFDPQARLKAMARAFDETVARVWPDQFLFDPADKEKLGASLRFYVRVVVVAFLIRWFVVEPRYIPSASMVPTLQIGDQLAVEKISTLVRTPRPSEVVLFRPPPAALGGKKPVPGQVFVKRVVAGPGDVVQVRDGSVFVNGQRRSEPFADSANYELGPMTVPLNSLFVLGDNRNRSFDSHVWGFLPTDHIIGHAILRYWPLDRFGQIEF